LQWLVVNRFVTDYQATLLSRGQVDDFFLGEYKVLERIGRGRMAGVYKAEHSSGQIVAIKVLPPSRVKKPTVLARFQREARLAIKLKHPHVVRSFQVGKTRDVHYLVMEHLEGETLEEVIARRKQLPPVEAVRIVHQALLGLQHIHEQGMVHRDLKPANLMLIAKSPPADPETTLNLLVKILDIGLAREFFDESGPADPKEQMDLTGEGTLLGTPDYLAPEQARDPRTIDIRADIYGLGCTLYHLLAGQPPFPDKNILNQMIRHATETPKPLVSFNPAIPEGLAQIVDWMMAKQPAQRYATPGRAAQALEAFLMVTEGDTPTEENPQLRKYLTWLETSAPDTRGAEHLSQPLEDKRSGPTSSAPVTPVAEAKADASVGSVKAPRKRKRRTGVDTAPALAKPVNEPASPPNQLDVELVALPDASANSAFPLAKPIGLRDLLFVGAGAIGMLALIGAIALFFLIIRLVF
jgi:serine/threonine protein kinase